MDEVEKIEEEMRCDKRKGDAGEEMRCDDMKWEKIEEEMR